MVTIYRKMYSIYHIITIALDVCIYILVLHHLPSTFFKPLIEVIDEPDGLAVSDERCFLHEALGPRKEDDTCYQ